jgi:hypothetical protein
MQLREENAEELFNFYDSNCDSIHHLYNANNSYVKSICHLDELNSFSVAKKECESLNLKLYVLKTKEDEEILSNHLNSATTGGSEKKFWIFGKKNDIGKWHANGKLYEGIVVRGNEGKCLTMSNETGTFGKFAKECSTPMQAICELTLSEVIRENLKIEKPKVETRKEKLWINDWIKNNNL